MGVFTITYSATADVAGNIPETVTVTVEIIDTTAPTITASPPSITLQIGETFTPPTVSVTDNDPAYSGTVTNSTSPGPVDTSSIGNYTITYSATADASNNAPTPVNVTDTTAPIITANPPSITLQIGQPFTPPTIIVMIMIPIMSELSQTLLVQDQLNCIGNYTITILQLLTHQTMYLSPSL